MYKSFFYYTFQPFTLNSAELLINRIMDCAPTKIEKFGLASGSMKIMKPETKELLSKLAVGYPEYFFGTLFLADKKGKATFYLEHRPDHLFRLQVEFTNEITETERRTFFERFVDDSNLLFALMTSGEEYDSKHLMVSEYSDGGRTEKYVGYNFFNGIPGVYETTYFGNSLVEILDVRKLTDIQKMDFGYILNCKNSLSEDTAIDLLGKECFFDIKTPDRKVIFSGILQELTNKLHHVDFSIRPQFSDSKFEINGEQAKQAYQKLLENLIDYSLIKQKDTIYIQELLNKILSSVKPSEVYGDTTLACGYFLGTYWSDKFSRYFDTNKGVVFKDNDQEYILSPYNTIVLIKKDGLTIQEMEDCVSYMV